MAYVSNIRMFVRVFELGSMSAAARDQRTSPAVASARIAELERHLGIRLFNRTTRRLQPTENGRLFYDGARKVLEAIDEAEAAVMASTRDLRGTVFCAAPLGVGRRFIAPHVPAFKDEYPRIDVRLRLSDRKIDVIGEGLDLLQEAGAARVPRREDGSYVPPEQRMAIALDELATAGLGLRGYGDDLIAELSLIHISEPTRPY